MPLPYPPIVTHTPIPVAGRRAPRDAPVEPPAGYRWHFDVDSWRAGTQLGDLELVLADVEVGDGGMLWTREPVPGKKRKTRLRPYFARASRPVYRLGSIRRLSRALVREHLRKSIREHRAAIARHQVLAMLPTGPTPPGGVSQPRRYKPDRWGQPGGPLERPAHPPAGGSGISR